MTLTQTPPSLHSEQWKQIAQACKGKRRFGVRIPFSHFHDGWRKMTATRPPTNMVQWKNGALENEIRLFWGSISTEPCLLEKNKVSNTTTYKPQTFIEWNSSTNPPLSPILAKTYQHCQPTIKVTSFPTYQPTPDFPLRFGLLRQRAIASPTHHELPHMEGRCWKYRFPFLQDGRKVTSYTWGLWGPYK